MHRPESRQKYRSGFFADHATVEINKLRVEYPDVSAELNGLPNGLEEATMSVESGCTCTSAGTTRSSKTVPNTVGRKARRRLAMTPLLGPPLDPARPRPWPAARGGEATGSGSECITGIARTDKGLIILLDLERLVARDLADTAALVAAEPVPVG